MEETTTQSGNVVGADFAQGRKGANGIPSEQLLSMQKEKEAEFAKMEQMQLSELRRSMYGILLSTLTSVQDALLSKASPRNRETLNKEIAKQFREFAATLLALND